MSIQQASRYAQIRLARRVGRSLPWIGAAIALYALGSAIRQKGLLGGTLDTALNAVPFVGGAKNVAEVIRGRDFIRDRAIPTPNVVPAQRAGDNRSLHPAGHPLREIAHQA